MECSSCLDEGWVAIAERTHHHRLHLSFCALRPASGKACGRRIVAMRCIVFLPARLFAILPLGRLRHPSCTRCRASVFSDDLSVYRQTDD
ncbi:hypothetical protein RHEC894_PD00491 (plasmid) [Rhizobium sp. CIAT894]|nr:hypothetical protein RHEC894_PD00491 [Rhizobium sp. CIAT894]